MALLQDRRGWLRQVALFAPILAGGCSRKEAAVEAPRRRADDERHDAELLSRAAELEESAVKVYTAAAALPFVKADSLVLTTAGRFLSQHAEHRDTLVKVARELGLGIDPGRAAMPAIPPEVLDAARPEAERKTATLRFARTLEMQAAKAYFGFITRELRTDFAKTSAADILPVEAQHVAVYDLLLKTSPPAPTPFFSEQV